MPDLDDLLFQVPDMPEVEQPKEIWGAIKTKYTAYKGAHKACDECVMLIHQKGVANAPLPGPARFKRTGPNGETVLCNAHKEQHFRLDRAAETAYAERVAQQEHAGKGR